MSVTIDYTGSRDSDFTAANNKAGLKSTPEGCTWHHKEDAGCKEKGGTITGTMVLIKSECHDAVKHTGGYAIAKDLLSNKCCALAGKGEDKYDYDKE